MRIKLINFKCYTEKILDISDQGITLITGASGCGKTSIMQAIYWCLYGKLRNIVNNTSTGKCSVTLYLNNLTIYRQSKPKLLKLTEVVNLNINANVNGLGNMTAIETNYEDLIAQQMIDVRFGDRETWLASSYISQDTRALLLDGSNSDRMSLLNKIAFTHDDPKESINRIDEEIKFQNEHFTQFQTLYTSELNIFQTSVNENQAIFNYMLTDDQKKEKHQLFEIKSQRYRELTEMKTEQTKNSGKLSTLESGQIMTKNKLIQMQNKYELILNESNKYYGIDYDTKLSEITKNKETSELVYKHELTQLTEKKNNLQLKYNEILATLNNVQETEKLINAHHLALNNELTGLNNKEHDINLLIDQKKNMLIDLQTHHETSKAAFEKYPEFIQENVWKNWNEQSVWKTKQQLNEYETMLHKAKSIGLTYELEIIENAKIQLNDRIASLSKMENESLIHEKIKNLEALIDPNLSGIQPEQINKEIDNEKLHYTNLSAGKDLLTCPHCQQSVRLMNGKINKAEVKPASQEEIQASYEQLKKLMDRKTKYDQQVGIINQINNLKSLVTTSTILSVLEIKNEIVKNKAIADILNKITYVEKPKYEPDFISASLKYREHKTRLDNFTFDPTPYVKELNDINDRKQKVLNETHELKEKKEKLLNQAHIQSSFQQLQRDIKDVSDKINKHELNYKQEIQKYIKSELEINQAKQNQVKFKNDANSLQAQCVDLEKEFQFSELEINRLKSLIVYDLDQQITNIYNELFNIKYHLDQAEKCLYFHDQQKKLNDRYQMIMTLHNQIIALNNFRQIAIDLECELLQSTVNTINASMNEILDNIFDMPILVTLKLYKKMKSNKRIKPSVNLVVSYKGVDYDNITCLSGGEADRVSMALVIAMNKIHLSPILLLDEAMKSINDDLRAATLESLRRILLPYKSVICINHEDTAGNYDNHISIE